MQTLAATQELERHRGRTDIRLDELVDIANHLIRLVVPTQPSERVSIALTERTLRFYIAQGLIDRPLGKEGAARLYGYRHLLQALMVKALQGAYLPIKRIRELVAGKSEGELEAMLAGQVMENPPGAPAAPRPVELMAREVRPLAFPGARQRALNYLNYLRRASPPAASGLPDFDSRFFREDEEAAAPPDLFRTFSHGVKSAPPQASDTWERFTLADGVELHLRADRVKDLRPSEIRRLVERLLRSLKGK